MSTPMLVHLLSLLVFAASPAYTQTITQPVTISYSIKVNSGKKSVTVADGYDGGSRTVFLEGNRARIRMVSLMRMESIFFTPAAQPDKFAILVKESGKDAYKRNLTKTAWAKFNNKYEDASCTFENDSLEVLGFNCKKAIVSCKDGGEIILYYTPELPTMPEGYEPAFACIPGMVMQYEYSYKSVSILYQAISISRDKISPDIFKIPARINRRIP